jgi:hypothetical protein
MTYLKDANWKSAIGSGLKLFIFPGLLILMLSLEGTASGAETTLAQDSMELFPELRGKLLSSGQQASFGKAAGSKRFIIRIKQVKNLSGNNPFNTRQPLLNYNGQEVLTVGDLVGLIKGSQNALVGVSLSDCQCSGIMHRITADPIWGANFDIDPETLECRTPPPGIVGQGNFSITYAPNDSSNTAYFVGSPPPNVGDWVIEGGGTMGSYTAGNTVSFTAVSNTGKKLKVTFKVSTGDPAALQVLSLTPLN